MTGTLQPLQQQFRIVDERGQPTLYFIQWAQQRQIDIGSAITAEQAVQIVAQFLAEHPLTSLPGIALTNGGNIAAGVQISAQVQEILDQISTTQGTVLFRGAADWQALAPGTSGHFLKTNGAGADPAWAAGGGGGGGGSAGVELQSAGTPPPALASWTQQNFNAVTSAVDLTPGTDSAVAGVRIKYLPTVAVGNVNSVRALIRPLPGVRWRVSTFIRFHGLNSTYNTYGLILREAATNKSVTYGWISEVTSFGRQLMTNDTTYSSATTMGSASKTFESDGFWIRLSYDGTSTIVGISRDGYAWVQIRASAGQTDGFFTTAPSHAGIQLGTNDQGLAGAPQQRFVDCLSWKEEVLP